MAIQLPKDFISVADAWQRRDGTSYNLMGLVTDYLPSAKTRGTDYSMKIHVWDTSCHSDSSGLPGHGMVVRVFRRDHSEMPQVESVGDVIMFWKLRTKAMMGSQWIGISNPDTTWLVIPVDSLAASSSKEGTDVALRISSGDDHRTLQPPPKPSAADIEYAKELYHLKDLTTLRHPPQSTALDRAQIIDGSGGNPPPYKGKYRMLSELTLNGPMQFADLFGEVKKVFDGGRQVVEMRLTDYSENALLFDYPYEAYKDVVALDGNSWRGPFGKRTILVNLWDEHAEYLRELARRQELYEGSYVQIKNVQVKMDRNGQQLEGHCRGGSTWGGTSISLHRPREAEHDEKMKNLLKRKRDYLEMARSKDWYTEKDPWTESKKRTATNANAQEQDTISGNTSAAERPAKKSRRSTKNKNAKAKAAARAAAMGATNSHSTGHASTALKLTVNEHVHTENIEIPMTTLSSILGTEILSRTTPLGNSFQLPFQNCKYKTRAQVFDFFPDELEDFAVPYRQHEFDVLNEISGNDSDASEPSHGQDRTVSPDWAAAHPNEVSWKWHFFLFATEPHTSAKQTEHPENLPFMLLQVADTDADYLFNMEACDLRNNPSELAKLKEKLFVLWGELEELKTQHKMTGEELRKSGISVSSMPFECFVREFGIQAHSERAVSAKTRWERAFSIFGTRIC